jgi:prolyl-tRNA editing enzyme YbaK/EbsC (Cys-tRNA(Pro) deacylase)
MSETECNKIIEFLSKQKIAFKLLEHEKNPSKNKNNSITGIKAIVLKTSTNSFILACLPLNKKIDLKKLAKILGVKRVFLATASEVLRETNCEIGTVSPFGKLFGIKTFFDKSILEKNIVEFSIGVFNKSIQMKAKDLVKALKPEIKDFCKNNFQKLENN